MKLSGKSIFWEDAKISYSWLSSSSNLKVSSFRQVIFTIKVVIKRKSNPWNVAHFNRFFEMSSSPRATALRWCYKGRFATTIFSATQRYNIVATLIQMVATLFQHCNAVLRKKSSLRIVPCNITFKANNADYWKGDTPREHNVPLFAHDNIHCIKVFSWNQLRIMQVAYHQLLAKKDQICIN